MGVALICICRREQSGVKASPVMCHLDYWPHFLSVDSVGGAHLPAEAELIKFRQRGATWGFC